MQTRQTGTRIALLISLILHLAAILSLKDVIFHKRTYKSFGALNVELIKLPSSPTKPPPHISKRTIEFIRKTRTLPAEASPESFSIDKLPRRSIVARNTDESIPEAEILVMDTKASMKPSLASPFSDAISAEGSSSQGKGTGKRSGSGRGGLNLGGLASVPDRKIQVSDSSIGEKLQVYTEADFPFVKALQEIAQHVLTTTQNRKVDIVFIIDTSESMQDDIDAAARHLNKMIDRFQETNLDFTLGIVRFHHSLVYEWLGMDITISPQTSNVEEIRKILRSMRVSGGERALDALMQAISEVKFRSGADRHFILVTDEYVKGTYSVAEVLKAAKRAKISIDVIGRDEPFQRTIAEQTGGIWTPIENVEDYD